MNYSKVAIKYALAYALADHSIFVICQNQSPNVTYIKAEIFYQEYLVLNILCCFMLFRPYLK